MNILAWSGGKDSTATLLIDYFGIKEINKKMIDMNYMMKPNGSHIIDRVFCSLTMADRSDSSIQMPYPFEKWEHRDLYGEVPEHIYFVLKIAKIFRSWGYIVDIIPSKKTFLECFFTKYKRSKKGHNGKFYGFPISGLCVVQKDCKIKVAKEYYKQFKYYTSIVGIAADEIKRIETSEKNGQISLLKKYGIFENQCFDICKISNMLNPTYNFANRGGCWFCPNSSEKSLRNLYDNYNDLWNILMMLESVPNRVSDTFCYGKKYSQFEELFKLQDTQIKFNI